MTYLSLSYLLKKLEFHSGLSLHQFCLLKVSNKRYLGLPDTEIFYTHYTWPDLKGKPKRLLLGSAKDEQVALKIICHNVIQLINMYTVSC